MPSANVKGDKRTEQLKAIRDEVFNLKESPLYSFRQKNHYYPVLGEGSHETGLVFIGEAPGKNEAQQGRPFCGAAGKLLDELIESIGLTRSDVYITNVVKDRPPENRDPTDEEFELYGPFLKRQIDIIQPKIIATLGRHSMRYVMDEFDIWEELRPISENHGRVFGAHASYGPIKIVSLYHPAAAIYNRAMLQVLKDDFQILKKLL